MKPVVIEVFGDKSRKLEPEQHRIEFPGGYISIDRTSDDDYWVHIGLSTEGKQRSNTHMGSAKGQVIGSRVDFDYTEYARRLEAGLEPIPDIDGMENAQHLAVKIRPTKL